MKAPISLCLIVKNEPLLENSINSIKDYVSEIIIVDTGSTDGTDLIAQKYANKYEKYTACNDSETGLINDFSEARQRSFNLASQPWVMWMDADDEITGGEHLLKIIEEYKDKDTVSIMFPYEYAYNADNKSICTHYRERLVKNKENFHWVNPVHEVLVHNEGTQPLFLVRDDVMYKHRRQYGNKVTESGRNLRILRKYFEKHGDSDARQLYYLGLECFNAGLVDEAIERLTKYIEVSGWDDERCMACLKLIDIYIGKGEYEKGLSWAYRLIALKETWGEGYFALGKLYYFMAQRNDVNAMRHWERSANFIKMGLDLPPTQTLLFIDPTERQFEIHKFYNVSLSKVGRYQEALDSVNKALSFKGDEETLLNNRKFYENFINRNAVNIAINKLMETNLIDKECYDAIQSIINTNIIPVKNKDEVIKDNNFDVAIISKSSNEWHIPNTIDFNSLPIKMTDEQLEAVVLMVWKQYLLHDELLSAISFLEKAPYNVRHNVNIQKALYKTKSCLEWSSDDDEFVKLNAPANNNVEAGNPLPKDLYWQEGHRFNLILEKLKSNSTLVDFGCMDGCFTNRYGLKGHKPVGLDGCETSVALANKKAIEFNTGAKHIHTYFKDSLDKLPLKSFEYATSTDTYEHLIDPVNDMLIPGRELLKDDGTFLLVTPNGSWLRGQYCDWASPWVDATNGKSWLDVTQRPHIVAPSVWTVVNDFKKAGFDVKNCFINECKDRQDVPGQGNIFAEAIKSKNIENKLDIIFVAGDGVEFWTPLTVKENGIGGSETMLLEQAKRLAGFGHRVRVYNSCGTNGEGVYDGVEYYQTSKYQDLKCDILIVSRNCNYLADNFNIKAKMKLLWVHDVCAIAATSELLLKADKILALTEWHKKNLIDAHDIHPDQIIVTRNGIDLTRFDKKIERNKYRVVNSSSPDRSWAILLDMWKDIKMMVPKAELHLYYGFKNWEYSAKHFPGQPELIQYLKDKIKELEPLGVVYHDRVSQEQLAEEFLKSGVLAYPTWFTETSCQLAGSLIFTKNGMKKIEDIQVGDLVLTHMGRFRKVTELIKKEYSGKLYSIKRRKDFNSITLTEEHPLLNVTFNKRSDSLGNRVYNMKNLKINWETPNNIDAKNSFLASPIMKFGNLNRIKFSDYIDLPIDSEGKIGPKRKNKRFKRINNEIILTEELMYMLGLFAAEGCATNKKGKNKPGFSKITFAMHIKEMLKAKRVIDFFGSGKINKTSENGISIDLNHSVWARFLSTTIGTGISKKIPDFVWDCSKELQHSFMLGMFEGDGCTSNNTSNNANKIYKVSSYTSISPSLTYGISQLLSNQGIFSSILYNEFRRAYTLSWQKDSKFPQHKKIEGAFVTKVNKIDIKEYNGLVYNFEVEEDHSYVTDRTIVHNCMSAMEAQAAGLRITTSSIAALNETVSYRGTLIPGDWTTPEYKMPFINSIIKQLREDNDSDREHIRSYAYENFGLDDLAKKWEQMFYELIEELKINPISPYQPTIPYRNTNIGYMTSDTRKKVI